MTISEKDKAAAFVALDFISSELVAFIEECDVRDSYVDKVEAALKTIRACLQPTPQTATPLLEQQNAILNTTLKDHNDEVEKLQARMKELERDLRHKTQEHEALDSAYDELQARVKYHEDIKHMLACSMSENMRNKAKLEAAEGLANTLRNVRKKMLDIELIGGMGVLPSIEAITEALAKYKSVVEG